MMLTMASEYITSGSVAINWILDSMLGEDRHAHKVNCQSLLSSRFFWMIFKILNMIDNFSLKLISSFSLT